MKTLIIMLTSCLLLAPLALAGLSTEEILRIAEAPATEKVPDAFAKFPAGSSYRITSKPKGDEKLESFIAKLKYVEDRYLVSQTEMKVGKDFSATMFMVTEYDKELEIYRKSVLVRQVLPEKSDRIIHLVGNFNLERRVMNWTSFPDESGRIVTAIDAFTNNSSTVKEIIMQDGKVVSVLRIDAEEVE